MTIIELMVAVVLGILAAIVMMQMFGLSEGRRRTLSSGADAQTTGAISLYLMERDLRQAGYGLAPNTQDFTPTFKAPPIGTLTNGILAQCSKVVAYQKNRSGGADFWYANSTFAPVVINPTGFAAGDDNTDIIMVNYSGSAGIIGNGADITLSTTTTQAGGGGQDFVAVNTIAGFNSGDVVLAVPPAGSGLDCTIGEVTGFGNGGADSKNIYHNNTDYLSSYSSGATKVSPIWNKNTTGITWTSNGRLYNLGPVGGFISKVYAIRGGNLTVCDMTNSDCSKSTSSYWTPIASGVLGMSVQYGKDTDFNGSVDTWDKTTPSGADWAKVVAVRVGLVSRSGQYEKAADYTAITPAWKADAPGTLDASFTTTSWGSDWQRYRYFVAQSLVPLRNMMWGEQQ